LPKLTIAQLEKKYRDAVQATQPHYDEQKHNVMLYAGNHYSKVNSKIWQKVRDSKNIPENVKIRLTKNHLNRIMKSFINNTISYAPGVTILPKDSSNIHDIKQAKLSRSVLDDYKYKSKYEQKVRRSIENFFIIGECFVKIVWDASAGDIVGYEGLTDELGQPILDQTGQPVIDENKPVFEGGFITEVIPGFDIFIDRGSRTIDESPFIGVKKMVQTSELEGLVENDPMFTPEEKEAKLQYIKGASNESYAVFNPMDSSVSYPDDQTLTKEYYFKPCMEYPKGYFYITTTAGILWEGELQTDEKGKPVFPIKYALCDEFEGSPRGYSPMKQGRPVQAEINRASSKIAETQITLGDDKIITMQGSGITEGEKLNGIRQIKVSNAMDYKIVEGRSGEQYLNYVNDQITELYRIMGIQDDSAEKQTAQDMQLKLYQSLKDKKKFTFYSDKVERFLVEWADAIIKLSKANLRDDTVIKAVGSNEAINIEEFKNTNEMCYDIKVVPLTDDVESTMGKYMQLNNVLQYGKLDERTTGMLIKELPFVDGERIAGHLALAHTEAENIILALDRGEMPVISIFDNNEVIVQELVRRMRQGDWKYLISKNPQVEQNYMKQYEERVANINQKMEELKKVNMGIIPTGGPQIKVDAYIPDPSNPAKSVRATVDQKSFEWFIERLGEQGATMEVMPEAGVQTQIDMLSPQASGGVNNQGPVGPQGV
jgi:hypothetical protein